MGNRGMILPIGTGLKNPESLLNGLQKSIEDAAPDILALTHSATSQSMAEALQERLGGGYEFVFQCLSNENNVDRIFSEIVDVIEKLCRDYNCDLPTLKIDFTSGTKAMSAGAVLAALSSGVQQLRYIAGERKDGTVQSGLETILTLNPTRYRAFYDLQLAKVSLRNLRFSSALSLLNEIPVGALPVTHRETIETLTLLTEGYEAWDLFRHGDALNRFKKIGEFQSDIQEFALPKERIQDL